MSGAPRTDVGTVEDLHASAIKACGLDDFGADDDNYREALGVLLDSFRRDADLTELGSKMHRFFVRNALVARLVSEAAFKQYPQHVDVPIERPIFVTGLPRTGTTVDPPAAHRRPAAPGSRAVAGRVPAAPAAARNLVAEPGLPADRRAIRQGARGEPGLHRAALHDRRRGGGVLAAAAPVAALGVL